MPPESRRIPSAEALPWHVHPSLSASTARSASRPSEVSGSPAAGCAASTASPASLSGPAAPEPPPAGSTLISASQTTIRNAHPPATVGTLSSFQTTRAATIRLHDLDLKVLARGQRVGAVLRHANHPAPAEPPYLLMSLDRSGPTRGLQMSRGRQDARSAGVRGLPFVGPAGQRDPLPLDRTVT